MLKRKEKLRSYIIFTHIQNNSKFDLRHSTILMIFSCVDNMKRRAKC